MSVDKVVDKVLEKKQDPLTKYDDDWYDFIFSHFKESELSDGKPTCVGLRRVCEKVYGKILGCTSSIVRAPSEGDRAATVLCTIECKEHAGGSVITQSASADVYPENTQHPYNLHPVATAETRAEGRALRKLLNLDCLTSEEASSENTNGRANRITETQSRTIRRSCERFGIDLDKFLAKEAGVTQDALDMGPTALPKSVAERILVTISGYHEDRSTIPDDIKAATTATTATTATSEESADTELYPTPTCS